MKKILVGLFLTSSIAVTAQNVGVGETAPASKLAVKGSLSVGTGYSATAAPTNGAIVQGNVGIGTTAPTALLHMYSTTASVSGIAQSTLSGSYAGWTSQTPLATYFAGINTGTSRWCIFDNINNGERISVLPSGNIGIGVIAPSTALEVLSSSSNSSIKTGGLELQSYSINNSWVGENIYYNGSNYVYRNNGTGNQLYMLGGDIQLTTAPSGTAGASVSPTTRMMIKNAGNVGIGTTGPLYRFHVISTGNTDGIIIQNTAGGSGALANLYFATYGDLTTGTSHPGARISAVDDGAYSAAITFATKVSGGDANAMTERMRISSNGNVGIGTTGSGYPLEVENTENAGYGSYSASGSHEYLTTTVNNSGANPISNIAIFTLGRVVATEVDGFSDRRIKKDFHISDPVSDLETLQKVEVTDFRYKDEVANGTNLKKGFIAQQLETCYPEAVTQNTGILPDIYAPSSSVAFDAAAHTLTVTMVKAHGLTEGDKVRLMLDKQKKEVIVSHINSDNSFTVSDWTTPVSSVFVYGKEVHDFRAVDYDRVYTLNVSATQELAKQLREAKDQIAKLNEENKRMNSQNSTLQSDVDKLKASVETMQQIIERKAEK